MLFQYEVVTASVNGPNDVFTAAAAADVDGDGVSQLWGYVRPLAGGAGGQSSTLAGGQPAANCAPTGTWSATAAAPVQLSTVGPCDGSSGQSVF